MKNLKPLDIFYWVTIWIILFLLFFVIPKTDKRKNDNIENPVNTGINPKLNDKFWSWDTTLILSWTWTWDVMVGIIENKYNYTTWNVRQYIDNILQVWISGFDYIRLYPIQPQPRILSKVWWENNSRMLEYIEQNKDNHTFNFPDWVKAWYILVKTKKQLWNWEYDNLFLAVDYQNKWVIDVSKSLESDEDNTYIFDFTKIPQITDKKKILFFTDITKFIVNGQLSLTAITWEDDNPVIEIIIFLFR
jgi:hypothetical protein